MSYIESLNLLGATKQINKALELERKENLYKLYLAVLPKMTDKNYKSFEKFYEENTPKNVVVDTRSQDEIMAEIMEIKF